MASLWRHPGHLFWILLAYVPLLGWMSVPLTGDQKLYLSIALEMRQRGSWLTPYLFGETSYNKPPFQYWMTLLGWKVTGLSLWGALLPSALAAVGTAWFLGEIAGLLKGQRPHINAGLWFGAALGTATFGTVAQMEIWTCLFYAAAWWAGLKFLSAPIGERNWSWIYLAFAIAGASSLVKSPLYAVLWTVGFVAYLIVAAEWETFRSRHLYLACLAGVAVALSWFVAVLIVDGQRFYAEYWVRETWGKKAGNSGTVGSLWSALLQFCVPFSLLLFPASLTVWRSGRGDRMLKFVLCWCAPLGVFFSLYPYRITPYLYPLVPALACLVDWAFFRAGRTRVFRVTMGVTGVLFALVLGVVATVLARGYLAPFWVVGGFILAGAAALFFSLRGSARGLAISGLVAVYFFRAAAVALGEQDIKGLRLVAEARPQAPIGMLDEARDVWNESGMFSAALGREVRRFDGLDPAVELLRSGGFLILSDEQAEKQLRTIQAKLLGKGDERDMVESAWPRWKRRTKFPFKELIRQGRKGMPDFDERMKREFVIVSLRE